MPAWTVTTGQTVTLTEDAMEALGEALEQYHAAVGRSHGSLLVTLTLEADGALAAGAAAAELLEAHGLPSAGLTQLEVIDEREAERRFQTR